MGDYSMSFGNVYEIAENTLVEIYNFLYVYCEYCVDHHMT